MSRVDTFLELAVKQGGSDLHLVSEHAPYIRIHGVLQPVRFRVLSVEDVQSMLDEFMPRALRDRLDSNVSVDFAHTVEGLGRFRVNVYKHVRGLAAALRFIPSKVPSLEELGLPEAIRSNASHPKGLILVTGPTGSGKSTTLASIIDHINATRRGHIITLEDPIEFVHTFRQCVVTQREIGTHAPNLESALRDAVREDPDVILVGELRDAETISLALTAAETGIKILGTLHTSGATRSIDRIINTFPARRQEQARSMLADSLRMIVSQRLVRSADGSRRLAAVEILVNTHAAKAMIRAGNSHKLSSVIQAGRRAGMQSMDAVLRELVQKGAVAADEAGDHAIDPSYCDSRHESTTAL